MPDPGGGALDRLADQLAGKQLLLVLDNFEQVIEAAPQIGELLARLPEAQGAGDQPLAAACLRRAGVPGAAAGAARSAAPARTWRRSRSSPRWRSSSSAPWRCARASRSTPPTPRPSPRSASGWTGCRWRSSWRRRGSGVLTPQAILSRLGDQLDLLAGGAQQPAGPPADAARRHRLEPRPAGVRRSGRLCPPGGVRRRRRSAGRRAGGPRRLAGRRRAGARRPGRGRLAARQEPASPGDDRGR